MWRRHCPHQNHGRLCDFPSARRDSPPGRPRGSRTPTVTDTTMNRSSAADFSEACPSGEDVALPHRVGCHPLRRAWSGRPGGTWSDCGHAATGQRSAAPSCLTSGSPWRPCVCGAAPRSLCPRAPPGPAARPHARRALARAHAPARGAAP